MRYHLFLHNGWFLQNLGKDFIRTNMHTTVALTDFLLTLRVKLFLNLQSNYQIWFNINKLGCNGIGPSLILTKYCKENWKFECDFIKSSALLCSVLSWLQTALKNEHIKMIHITAIYFQGREKLRSFRNWTLVPWGWGTWACGS